MARPASRKAVSSLPAIANIDEQLDEVVMKIVIFDNGGSHVVNAPDGTLQWSIYRGDGNEDVVDVQMYEYHELSTHKFAYFAFFREACEVEIAEAIFNHGYYV